MNQAISILSDQARSLLVAAREPKWIAPMLARLSDRPFSDPAWLFERKMDGIRCLALRRGDNTALFSRTRQPLSATFPEVAELLAAQPVNDFVVDGEVVAFERGRTSFSRLQRRSSITDPNEARRSPVAVNYFLFDLLYLEGFDLRSLALRDRKRLLKAAFSFHSGIHFTPHRNGEGQAYFASACARGWEGVMAKRADSPYLSRRSRSWLKFKCSLEQEFVICGFTDPAGERRGLGALLLGYYEGSELRSAGKVGTGLDQRTLVELRSLLSRLETPQPPFALPGRWPRGTHFVRPLLVAQVAFGEWTAEGALRQPRFLALRPDKEPRQVVRETSTGA